MQVHRHHGEKFYIPRPTATATELQNAEVVLSLLQLVKEGGVRLGRWVGSHTLVNCFLWRILPSCPDSPGWGLGNQVTPVDTQSYSKRGLMSGVASALTP
jgi:hypothetical protein